MAGGLIFITGATGFLGFAILVDALKAGYRLRVSVRRHSSIQELSSHPKIAPYVLQNAVEFVIVPDITVEGAFDEVLKNVEGVLHVASPLPKESDDTERDIVVPAIHGTISILNSSLKHPSIKRVVITSSIAAILDADDFIHGSKSLITPSSRRSPLPTAPYGPAADAYRAAKALALDATDRFIAEKKPHFSIVNLLPGYVFGRNELVKTADELNVGSNSIVIKLALGTHFPAPRPTLITYIGDVARIHVVALDETKVVGNQTYILEGGKEGEKVVFEDVNEIVKREFEEAVNKGWLKGEGRLQGAWSLVDASETRKVFGELTGFEESVREVLQQWVELKKQEESRK
ncbi:NAD(P)-binding protein [Hyaloscypha variabilis F]|uniref:NAD(P)-binding protein n=1 Tax=Hyaloscypha variabilis (strain UAMH 11265 / GT02V1 / F) TaxID=1149755 RepID=A0A2J6R5H9_HYAVF|nr:NAD(P)-binding protein [Hyaloscypha variabilis F]